MRPSDRAVRDMLRRQAAAVPIPTDMWDNINEQLDADDAGAERRQQLASRGGQWRPAIVLAVAAGFFWFALIPSLPGGLSGTGLAPAVQSSDPRPWTNPGKPDPYNDPVAELGARRHGAQSGSPDSRTGRPKNVVDTTYVALTVHTPNPQ